MLILKILNKKINKLLYILRRIYQKKWKINMELYFLVIQNFTS